MSNPTTTTPDVNHAEHAPAAKRLREAHERAVVRAEKAETEVARLRRIEVENAALRAGVDPDGPAASVIVERWPTGLEPTPDAFREQFAQLTADVLRTQAAPGVTPKPTPVTGGSAEDASDQELAMQRAREALTRTEQPTPSHTDTEEAHDGR